MKWSPPQTDGIETTYIGEYRGCHLKVVVDNVILKLMPHFSQKEKQLAIKACDDYLDRGVEIGGRFDANGNRITQNPKADTDAATD
jgi:hypothetical protein